MTNIKTLLIVAAVCVAAGWVMASIIAEFWTLHNYHELQGE